MSAPPVPPRPESNDSSRTHSYHHHDSHSTTTAPYNAHQEDPTQEKIVTQADVDAQGRLPLRDRFHHISHTELNSSKKSCGPVPSPSRLPDTRLTVLVLGAEGLYGNHIMRGLANPAYSSAFDVRMLESAAVRQCLDANSLAQHLRNVHTVVAADSFIVQQGSGYVDQTDDQVWHRLLDACRLAKVKRFVASPFDWDLQLVKDPKKRAQAPDLIRRALPRREDLTNQKTFAKDQQIDYVMISVGLLTEQLFSPLAGVDLQNGVVRAPAGLGFQNRVTTTTLDDVARMLPEILLSADSHNKLVHLASAAITYEEVAEIVERATGNRVRRETVTLSDTVRQEALRDHTHDASATMAVLLEESKGLWWTKGNSWNAQYIPYVAATPVREWAATHLAQPNQPIGPDYQPNLHTTHTSLAPIPPTPSQIYFSVAAY